MTENQTLRFRRVRLNEILTARGRGAKAEFAKRMRCSPAYVSHLLSGRRPIHDKTFVRVLNALRMTRNEFNVSGTVINTGVQRGQSVVFSQMILRIFYDVEGKPPVHVNLARCWQFKVDINGQILDSVVGTEFPAAFDKTTDVTRENLFKLIPASQTFRHVIGYCIETGNMALVQFAGYSSIGHIGRTIWVVPIGNDSVFVYNIDDPAIFEQLTTALSGQTDKELIKKA